MISLLFHLWYNQLVSFFLSLGLKAESRKYFVCPMGLHLQQPQILVHHQLQAALIKGSCVILDWAARGTQQWFQESNYLSAQTRWQLQPQFIIEVNLPRQTKVYLWYNSGASRWCLPTRLVSRSWAQCFLQIIPSLLLVQAQGSSHHSSMGLKPSFSSKAVQTALCSLCDPFLHTHPTWLPLA